MTPLQARWPATALLLASCRARNETPVENSHACGVKELLDNSQLRNSERNYLFERFMHERNLEARPKSETLQPQVGTRAWGRYHNSLKPDSREFLENVEGIMGETSLGRGRVVGLRLCYDGQRVCK
jgi:hypothetical protein